MPGLADLPTAALEAEFRRCYDDAEALSDINRALATRGDDADTELQLLVYTRLDALRRARAAGEQQSQRAKAAEAAAPTVARWLTSFLLARRRPGPNGDPLYRYRMTDGEFEVARGLLAELHAAGRLDNPDSEAGAMFVAFGAEWFRREGTTLQAWDQLAPAILANVAWNAKARLAELGLHYWQRPLRVTPNGRQFLLSLALEGGIPVTALLEGGTGWLRTYLAAATKRAAAIANITGDVVLTIAREESGLLRQSYRKDDFIALCAELVGAVLSWRGVAAREAAGLDPVAWLDARHPHWRSEIPLHLPASDQAVATDLLNGLVRALPSQLSGDGVDCLRLLVRAAGGWRPAVQIGATGEMATAGFPFAPADGRIRARPAGGLAARLGDAIAVFDPPGDDGRTWLVRPAARLLAPIADIPFDTEIAVDLVAPGMSARRFRWPRGEPVRSRLLVFAAFGDALRLVGRGSARTGHATVFVLAPQDWVVRAAEGTAADAIGDFEEIAGLGARLHSISGAAWFGSDADDEWYLVQPGTDPDERRLVADGAAVATAESTDPRIDLCFAPVRITIARDQHHWAPRPGLVAWRHPGRAWQDAHGAAVAPGIAEIVWTEAGGDGRRIRRDRVVVAVLPAGATISGRMTGAARAEVEIGGLPGWSVTPEPRPDRTVEPSADGFVVAFTGRPSYVQPVTLVDPHGGRLPVSVRLPGRSAALVRADGGSLRANEAITMADLRGMMGVSPAPERLTLALGGVDAMPTAHISVRIDGELPLGTLRPAAEGLLAATANMDARIDLSLDGAGQAFRLTRFAHGELTGSGDSVATAENVGDAVAILRVLDDPGHEILLAETPAAGGRSWKLPPGLAATSVVYLRRGSDVVSRPHLVPRPELPPDPGSALRSASRIGDAAARKSALRIALRAMAEAVDAEAERAWLLGAICSLRGLPASALDVLKELAKVPEALAHLLMFAESDGDRSRVFALQSELPFLWLAIPASAWGMAAEKRFAAVHEAVARVLSEQAVTMAMDDLRRRIEAVLALEPALRASFVRAGALPPASPAAVTFQALAQAHINRSDHRDATGGGDSDRHATRLANAGVAIPPALAAFDLPSHPGLLAPCVLAASAAGRLDLTREDLFALRRALASDPDYTSTAFALVLPSL